MTKTKICTKCGVEKPLGEFYKQAKYKDGLHYWCKGCEQIIKTAYRKTEKGKSDIKKSYQKNKDKIKAYYSQDNVKEQNRLNKLRPERKLKIRDYEKEKYKNNIQFNLAKKMRVRMNKSIRNKTNNSLDLFGCDSNQLKTHIESLFTDGMSWDLVLNGEIHIDHIKPCSSFDLTDPEQQKQCFHYTNLQPLWSTTREINGITYLGNLNKSNKI